LEQTRDSVLRYGEPVGRELLNFVVIRMKPSILVTIVAACTVPVGCGALQGDPYAQHFASPLPEGVRLVHYQRCPAGFDVSHVFVFEGASDAFVNQIVAEWCLHPATEGKPPTSFVGLRPPKWWPSSAQLDRFPVAYAWVDERAERYRSVWVDPDTKDRVYAEYGRW
jgi:hypothetical protein